MTLDNYLKDLDDEESSDEELEVEEEAASDSIWANAADIFNPAKRANFIKSQKPQSKPKPPPAREGTEEPVKDTKQPDKPNKTDSTADLQSEL